MNTISFPGLGIGPFEVNEVAFTVFNMDIAWYALIITFGMILAVSYTIFRAKKIGVTFDDVVDFVIFVIPLGVLGARLYYVLSKLEEFTTLEEVLAFRNGGLAIYGGIIVGTITVFAVCYFKKIYFPAFGDCIVPGLILAQAIGRWGNFVNSEAYGTETESFIRMGVVEGLKTIYVHPTFLYESLWNIIGFILLNWLLKKKKYDGQVLLAYAAWYGFGRMLIEGLRTDSLMWGPFRVSQLLAALLFVVCAAWMIVIFVRQRKRKTEELDRAFEEIDSGAVASTIGLDPETEIEGDKEDGHSN